MNQAHIVKAHNMDVDQVSVSEPKTNDNGGKSIYLNYDNHPFIIQTPKMSMPYNMSVYDKGEYPKYSVEVSFRDMDTNANVKKFYDNFDELWKPFLDDREWFSRGDLSSYYRLANPTKDAPRVVLKLERDELSLANPRLTMMSRSNSAND